MPNPHITRKKHATVALDPSLERAFIQTLESQKPYLPDFDKTAPSKYISERCLKYGVKIRRSDSINYNGFIVLKALIIPSRSFDSLSRRISMISPCPT